MIQFETQVKLNVLALGSYDVLIGMDWLEKTPSDFKLFSENFYLFK